MRPPNCSQHGSLMLDLARGRLTDESASNAEGIRRSCPTCAAWWTTHLSGPPVANMDSTVEAAFASFEEPRQRRLSDTFPWAVAAVLALAVSFVLRPEKAPNTDIADDAQEGNLVVQESFNTDRNSDGVVDLSDVSIVISTGTADGSPEQQPIFGGDLESGDLTTWSTHSHSGAPAATS